MKHMSREGFVKMLTASELLADVMVTGSRQKQTKAVNLMLEWIADNKSKFEFYGKSRSCIYTRTRNLGTRKYPYIVTDINIADITEARDGEFVWRETDKCFISNKGERINKSKIVGWLT